VCDDLAGDLFRFPGSCLAASRRHWLCVPPIPSYPAAAVWIARSVAREGGLFQSLITHISPFRELRDCRRCPIQGPLKPPSAALGSGGR